MLTSPTSRKFLYAIDSEGPFAIPLNEEPMTFKCSDFAVTYKTEDFDLKRKFQLEVFEVKPNIQYKIFIDNDNEVQITGDSLNELHGIVFNHEEVITNLNSQKATYRFIANLKEIVPKSPCARQTVPIGDEKSNKLTSSSESPPFVPIPIIDLSDTDENDQKKEPDHAGEVSDNIVGELLASPPHVSPSFSPPVSPPHVSPPVGPPLSANISPPPVIPHLGPPLSVDIHPPSVSPPVSPHISSEENEEPESEDIEDPDSQDIEEPVSEEDQDSDDEHADESGFMLHISNLDVKTSKKDLLKLFKKYGPLKKIWMDESAPSFAFITFCKRANAEEAHRVFDGSEVFGQKIKVTVEFDLSKENEDFARDQTLSKSAYAEAVKIKETKEKIKDGDLKNQGQSSSK